MKKKRLILHIGTEKTGSTSIQEYLYINRKALNKHGYHFVQSAGKKNNRALVNYCFSDDHTDDFFIKKNIHSIKDRNEYKKKFIEKFKIELNSLSSNIHTVIISSEHFHSRIQSEEEVKNVFHLFSEFFEKIEIICFIREQADVVVSLYSTALKVGRFISLDKFINQKCLPSNIYFNYNELLKMWEKVFGKDALKINIFNKSDFLNFDLLDEFSSNIDNDLGTLLNKKISIQNESISYTGQIASKAVNYIFSKNKNIYHCDKTRIECQNYIFKYCKGKGEKLSLEEKKHIYNLFRESNTNVQKKYFPDREELFSTSSKEFKTDKSIDKNFIEVLSDLFIIIINNTSETVISDKYASSLRDAAIILESESPHMSLELMELAHIIRPNGQLIKNKIKEYKKLVNTGDSNH